MPARKWSFAWPNVGTPAVGHLQYFDPTDHVITIDWTIKQTANCLFAVTAVGG
jgi:hypothetical protein